MHGLLAALIFVLGSSHAAVSCVMFSAPRPSNLQYADTVAKVVLLSAEHGPEVHPDNYGITSSAILIFATIKTYDGPHKASWRVLWRGGDTQLVAPSDASPQREDAGGFDDTGKSYYRFPSRTFEVLRNGRVRETSLRYGDFFIVGIVSAKKRYPKVGCEPVRGESVCVPDGDGGFHDELYFGGCSAGLPYAFQFSEVLEAHVLDALAEAQ
jgi:hypothetical protein